MRATASAPWLLLGGLILLGLLLRLAALVSTPFWVDEAESSINGLTILDHGYPADHYLELPLFENTLIQAWEGDAEHEFRDSSYSTRGMVVYHGWLPLYAIAAAQALAGLEPDAVQSVPSVRHQGQWTQRALVPRLPALFFSLLFLVLIYHLAREWAGPAAGAAALTWAGLSEGTVLFGFQARYYSATLAMAALTAWAVWRVLQFGRWRDFVLAGLAGGLLFHTHQVSAVVFSVAAIATIPALRRRPDWLKKAAGAVGVAALLILPWSLWSGFVATAAAVPKVSVLFGSQSEWLLFLLQRPTSLLVFLGLLLLIASSRWQLLDRWPVLQQRLVELTPGAAILVAWLAVAYLAIHTIVPAASFFPNRLTLMMQVPAILLLGAVLGSVALAWTPHRSAWLAAGLTALLLVVTGKLAPFPGLKVRPEAFHPPAALALGDRTFRPDTRFYASPNDQLIYTYLTGLPVQSVAPIRRSFLESYPGPIVFIETRHVVTHTLEDRVREAARAAGEPVAERQVDSWSRRVWAEHVAQDLERRGLVPPALPPLPAFLRPVLDHLNAAEVAYVERTRRRMPIFRGVEAATAGDLWMSFSYRFVNYADRLGPANIHPRLQQAEVEFLPEAPAVIFAAPPLEARQDEPRISAQTEPLDGPTTSHLSDGADLAADRRT